MRRILTFVLGLFLILSSFAIAEEPALSPKSDEVLLSAYRGVVEEHLAGVLRDVRLVAVSSEAQSVRWEDVQPLLVRLSEDLATDATAWLALPDGTYFATAAGGVADEKLLDRQYFPRLMAGKEIVGDLVISKSTGHRSVVVATPIVSNGEVRGAIGVSLRVRLLSELVAEHLPLPEKDYFYVLNGETRIVLHRKAERMFKTPQDVGDEALGADFRRVIKADSGTFDYVLNGTKIASRFERSPSLGWYFFIARAG